MEEELSLSALPLWSSRRCFLRRRRFFLCRRLGVPAATAVALPDLFDKKPQPLSLLLRERRGHLAEELLFYFAVGEPFEPPRGDSFGESWDETEFGFQKFIQREKLRVGSFSIFL